MSPQSDDQKKKQPPPSALPDTLPGDFFDRPQRQEPMEVPENFFKLPFDKQQQYLNQPNTLPEDLPERTMKTVGRALPFAAAGAATLAAPEFGLPWYGALLTRGAIAGIGGAAGSLGQSAIYRGLDDEEAPTSIAEAVKRAEIEGAVQTGTELGAGLIGKGLGTALEEAFAPERLYQRGLKPPAGRGQKVSGPIVETGVQERIPLTEGGKKKLTDVIDQVNSDIQNMVNSSPTDIPPSDYVRNIQTRFDVLRQRYAKRALTGGKTGAAVDTLNEAERRFLINHGNVKPLNVFKGRDPQGNPIYQLLKPEDMTLAMLRARANPLPSLDAQAIKKETYEELRSLYQSRGQMVNIPGWAPGTHPGIVTEANQEIARALREELGNIYPGLHQLNARDGRLLDLDEVLNRYVNRETNRGLYRWGAGMLGAGVGAGEQIASGHISPAVLGLTAAGMIKGALDDPGILSYLAIALNSAKSMPGRAVVGRVGREALPTAARAAEFQTNQGWPRIHVIDPRDLEQPPTRGEAAPARPSPVAAQAAWQPEWSNMMADTAKRQSVPLPLLKVVSEQEGSVAAARQQHVSPAEVRSPKNAIGLMQVRPATASQFGYSEQDLLDPQKNIEASARELKRLLAKPEYRGKPGLVLAAYNAGEGAVKAAGFNVARMSKETRDYVRRGLKQWAELGLPADQAGLVDTGDQR